MDTHTVTQGTLRTREGRTLPLQRTEVRASIAGAVADVSVTQVFRNDGAAPIEAVYAFPLPHEASVYRMQFTLDDRVVRGVVRDKAEARRTYERARAEGRAATLLEEDAPAVFTLSVANVAPGVTIVVELAYQEALAYDDGRWRWAFPMVGPEHLLDAPSPSPGVTLPRARSLHRAADVSVEVMVRGDGAVEDLRCLSHAIHTRTTDDGVPIVSLAGDGPVANRDFVLVWRAGDLGVRPWVRFERTAGELGTFLLLLTPSVPKEHTERVGGHGDLKAVRCGNCGGVVQDLSCIREIPGLGPVVPCAFCGALLAPGTEVITRATRPRDVLVLIDRSASMRGAQPTIQRALRALLDALGPGDGVQVMAFDHDRTAFDADGTRFAIVSPELIAQAERFVATLSPRGGTELEEALSRAATIPAREGRTRVVVLMTDAAVGNEARLLRRVPELLGASTRLFVLGVGPSVNRTLVERLARAGGGASDVVLAHDDAHETLPRFARRVREGGAVLTNLTLYWEGAGMTDVYPKALPDLHGGAPVRVLGRFSGVGASKLVITGATADGRPFRQELTLGLPAQTERKPGLTRLWARRRVEDLAVRSGGGALDAAALVAEGTALSLAHSIVGPFTSLVAEDSKVSVDPKTRPKFRLRITEGKGAGQVFELVHSKVSVGRADDNVIKLEDAATSRHHFELTRDGDTWTLRDLQSTSGTFVNHHLHRDGLLRPGARILVGRTHLDFEMELPPTITAGRQEHDGAQRITSTHFDTEMFDEVPDTGASLNEASRAAPPSARGSAPMMPGAPPASMPAPMPAPMPAFAPAPMPARAAAPMPSSFGGPPPPRSPAPMAAPPPMAPPAPMAPPPPMAPIAPIAPMAPAPMAPAPMSPIPPPPGGPPVAPYPMTLSAPMAPAAPSEAYSAEELAWFASRQRGALDLVFLVDETASMGPYIAEVRAHLLSIVASLRASPLCRSLRLGVVSYRDHPPQDHTYASKVVPLTEDTEVVRRAVERLHASGGGDGPESVTDGLYDLVRLDWRPSAARAVVWFGDAPPHGVEPEGDAFPQGCPCGHHWFTQAESCREMAVAIYAIGCLPAIRAYKGAEAVFRKVADTSGGEYFVLREASLLVPLIVGAASAALDQQRLDEHVVELIPHSGETFAHSTDAERARWLSEALMARGVRVRAMAYDPNALVPSPQRFRPATAADVRASLDRLRLQQRVTV